MIRLVSALVLLPIVLAIVWYLPPIGTWVLGGVVLVLAFVEYAGLARRLSPGTSMIAPGVGTVIVYAAIGASVPLEDVLLPVTLGVALLAVARGRPDDDVLRAVGVALLPTLYLGAALGLALQVRTVWGAAALLLPFLTIVASDSAQYYGGRLLGRRPLAPAISPKKTIEGAVAGLVVAALVTPLLGVWAFPGRPSGLFALLGVALAALGICGDLFESLLKRSTGVKDASGLIPGHGGMLDRIDSLLFAGPVYYLFLKYSGW